MIWSRTAWIWSVSWNSFLLFLLFNVDLTCVSAHTQLGNVCCCCFSELCNTQCKQDHVFSSLWANLSFCCTIASKAPHSDNLCSYKDWSSLRKVNLMGKLNLIFTIEVYLSLFMTSFSDCPKLTCPRRYGQTSCLYNQTVICLFLSPIVKPQVSEMNC